MTMCTNNQRRWQVPYRIVTLWSAYVLIFLGGVYLLAREYAAVYHADAYAVSYTHLTLPTILRV